VGGVHAAIPRLNDGTNLLRKVPKCSGGGVVDGIFECGTDVAWDDDLVAAVAGPFASEEEPGNRSGSRNVVLGRTVPEGLVDDGWNQSA
jgi:hypothetical protein